MAQKRNGAAANGRTNRNKINSDDDEQILPGGIKPHKATERLNFVFKHPFGNISLEEHHDQVDTFKMSYLLMGLASFGFLLLVSIIIIVLAEADQIHRSKQGSSTSTGH